MSEEWSRLGADLWAEARPIGGTPAETYLRSRGISLMPGPEALRFHRAVEHPKLKRKFPALIARVTGSAEPSHNFTWLAADGKGKARLNKEDQRRTLGSSKGGSVRLVEPVDGKPLIVGEGIETTATAIEATGGLPGWASLGTSGLGAIEWPDDIREVILLAENDDSGANHRALEKVCLALAEKGLKVRVASPPVGFNDFNDLIDPGKKGGGPGGLMIAKIIIDAAPEWSPKRSKGAKPVGPKQASQASFLVELAASRCSLFCDPAGEAYASFEAAHAAGEHRETHRLRSKNFNLWLRLLYYAEKNGAPSSEAMASAVKTLMAKAHFDGDRREVFLRTAPLDGKIYVDMGDPFWRAIEIDAEGFRIVDDPPAHFRREAGMLPLPTPSTIDPRKGVERLREVLRLRDKRDFVVVVAWLLAALAGRSPYAVIIFLGEPGATKTSAAYAVRSIVDPNASPLRARPKEPHDVFVAATHSLIVGYNNLSSLSDLLSDTISVVSEGSGESRRELFTDADESLIVACAPFLLTGIENVIKRGDLAQRTLYVHLASVPDGERMTEQAFKARFKRAHADLLGALCAAASIGLKNEKTLKLASLPRLATFFHWASACETAFWRPGEFRRAFAANARDATEDVIESEQAASVFRRYIVERGKWEGTATQLLAELVAFVRRPVREAEAAHAQAVKDRDDVEKEKTAAALRETREMARDIFGDRWPKAPQILTGKLKRASPALRNAGVRIEWPTRHGEVKIIKIAARSTSNTRGRRASRSSPASSPHAQAKHFNGLAEKTGDASGLFRDASRSIGDASAPGAANRGAPNGDALGEGGTAAGRLPPEAASHATTLNSMDNLAAKRERGAWDAVCPSMSDADPIAARIVSDFDKRGFQIALTPDGALAIHDVLAGKSRPSRAPPPQLLGQFGRHADAIGRWLEGRILSSPAADGNGGAPPNGGSDLTTRERIDATRGTGGRITLWPDANGFDVDLRLVSDTQLRDALVEVLQDPRRYDEVLEELKRENSHD
jgi:hypothetical protein